ncbi:MAG: hypothetical protein U0804_18915 [Gemmataceae bacterium]
MNWKRIAAWAVVAFLAVLLIGWGVALLVDPYDLTRQISVFGGVVAVFALLGNLGKIGYDIWDKERDRKKKDEDKKEKLKATALYSPPVSKLRYSSPGIDPDGVCVVGVKIYNEGSAPVHVKSVRLVCREGTTHFEPVPLYVEAGKTESFTCLIEPKHFADFYTVGLTTRVKGSTLGGILADDFRIEVETFGTDGVLVTVPGTAILYEVGKMNPAALTAAIQAHTDATNHRGKWSVSSFNF